MEIRVYRVNAFTDKLPGGNPAGLVLDSGKLTSKQMENISREINLSETAFVEEIGPDYFNVRFFTPICEVELCGHATIGSFYFLAKMGYIKANGDKRKKVYQETKAGKLEVELIYKDNKIDRVLMEQSSPQRYGAIKKLERLGKIMGIGIEDIGIGDLPVFPEIISTGLKDIILPLRRKETLDNLDVNMDQLSKYSRELGVVGLHAFYLPELNGDHVYTRNFAPAVGIDEESATGTSNGALIYFLKANGFIRDDNIIAHQGYLMGRPSKIYCNISKDNDKYIVKVGGKALIAESKIIKI